MSMRSSTRSLSLLVLTALPLALLLAGTAAADQTFIVHVGTSGSTMYTRPAALTAQAGEKLTITVVNDDVSNGNVSTPHDIKFDGHTMARTGNECAAVPAANREESQGAEFEVCDRVQATGTFTAAAGSWDYHCEVPGHEQAGMIGKLTVQGSPAKTPGLEPLALLAVLGFVALARRR